MKFLDSLEKRFGRYAQSNVVLFLIGAQILTYGAISVGQIDPASIVLFPDAVFAGEWWRLITFLATPPYFGEGAFHIVTLAFFWYILWFTAQTLEAHWGIFRLNVYLLSAVIFAIAGVFIGQALSPNQPIYTYTTFLKFTVFFAFATIHPNIQFQIWFLIPIKVKWIAWLVFAIGTINILGIPTIGAKIAMAAPYLCYPLFFKDTIIHTFKARQRRARFDSNIKAASREALHTCSICGATEKTHPDRDFRYKTVDGEAICICSDCREKGLG